MPKDKDQKPRVKKTARSEWVEDRDMGITEEDWLEEEDNSGPFLLAKHPMTSTTRQSRPKRTSANNKRSLK